MGISLFGIGTETRTLTDQPTGLKPDVSTNSTIPTCGEENKTVKGKKGVLFSSFL